MREHALSDKMIGSAVCGDSRFHILINRVWKSGACGSGRIHILINRVRPLTDWLTAARAGQTASTFLSFGYCPPQEVLRTAYGDSPCGGHKLCEHALSGKMIGSDACKAGRFHNPIIRVWKSAAYGDSRLYIPSNRV